MKGIFDLASPEDLFRKLEHDYRRVQADATDVYAAFDFVVTAWHLLEWRYPGGKNREPGKAVWKETPILRVCEHLAVGSKHFEPHDGKLTAVRDSQREAVWGKRVWAPGVWAPGVWRDDLVVTLDSPEAAVLGPRLTLPEVADHAMAFWRAQDPFHTIHVAGK